MALYLRRAADHYSAAGWKPGDGHLMVLHGGRVIGSIRRIANGPQQDTGSWSVWSCHVLRGMAPLHGLAASKGRRYAL